MNGAAGASILHTACRSEPMCSLPSHIHRGGLLGLLPSSDHQPHAIVWFPDDIHRLTYSSTADGWILQLADDLQWAYVARILTIPSPFSDVDLAVTPDGTPMLARDTTYLIRHEAPPAQPCRVAIRAASGPWPMSLTA